MVSSVVSCVKATEPHPRLICGFRLQDEITIDTDIIEYAPLYILYVDV